MSCTILVSAATLICTNYRIWNGWQWGVERSREGFLKVMLPELGFDGKIRHCSHYFLCANTQVFSSNSYPLFNPSLTELLLILTFTYSVLRNNKYLKFCPREVAAFMTICITFDLSSFSVTCFTPLLHKRRHIFREAK